MDDLNNSLKTKTKGNIINNKQTTHLRCHDSKGVVKCYSKNNIHAEQWMLEKFEEKPLPKEPLPKEIWLSRSPCEECAMKLLQAYKKEAYKKEGRACPRYPKINIAHVYVGGEKFSTELQHVRALIELMRNGFEIVVWGDLAGEDDKDDLKEADRKRMKTVGDRLEKCRDELNPTLIAQVGQIPLLYYTPQGSEPRKECQCTVLLTLFAEGVKHSVKPMVVFQPPTPARVSTCSCIQELEFFGSIKHVM